MASTWSTSRMAVAEAYLGRGWAFPVRWVAPSAGTDGRVAAAMSVADDDVREAIEIILETMLGERVMHPDFGSQLHAYLFAPMTVATRHALAAEIQKALTLWEHRITDVAVTICGVDEVAGRIDLEVTWAIEVHQHRQSLVYPFYVGAPERW